MAQSETLHALARLLIGLAWEDGEVTPEEMNLVKDILFRLSEITPEDWRELELYWMTPIRQAQIAWLGEQFITTLESNDAKKAAYDVLLSMVQADGRVTSEETAVLREIQRDIDRVDSSLVAKLGKLLQSALPKRSEQLAGASNRQDYIQDFMRNHVYRHLKNRYGEDIEQKLGLSEDEIRKLGLTGALMGQVAYADYDIDDNELIMMHETLQRDWSLYPEHAAVVVEYAVDAASHYLDDSRLIREFFEATTLQERIDFLDILFDIAHAHAGISEEETLEIQHIAEALKMPPAEFQAARDRALRFERMMSD